MKLEKKNSVYLLCLFFVLGINLYFRAFPIYFPQLKTHARNLVKGGIQQGITSDVYKRFPQFIPLAKEAIARPRIAEYEKQNKRIISAQAEGLYNKLKDRFQDDGGQTYLMELDCWHWARYVENVVRLGHPGDEVMGGRQWDLFMLAPTGMYLNWEQLLFYFSAYLYKLFNFFHRIPVFTFVFYLPLLFSAVFITVLYRFSYRLGGNIAAVTSCLFVGLSPIFLHRSCAGWFDKDILNLLFPVLLVAAYLSSYGSRSFLQRSLWVLLMSFWAAVFCSVWTHWWFIFLIIAIYEGVSLAYLIFSGMYLGRKRPLLIKERMISLFLFFIFTFLWIIIFLGDKPLVDMYGHIKWALTLNKPLMSSIWPNVYYTVGELKRADINEIAHMIWGVPVFVISLLCMLALFVRLLRPASADPADNPRSACIAILVIWVASMVFASFRGVRFVVFLLIPLGVSLGWAASLFFEYFKKKRNLPGTGIAALSLIVLYSFFVIKANQAASSIYPLMDDNWYEVLNIIKTKTPGQTVVNSWWDFGDWFKAVAGRRVIFDGQTQEYPQAYWMANVLLTHDEEEAIRILRMVNNGGNKAFEIINKHVPDQLEAVLLLEYLFRLTPEQVQTVLLRYLPPPAAKEVFTMIFAPPAPASFIVEYTMLPKMPAISYLGNWDFSKVYIAQKFAKEERDNIIGYLEAMGKDRDLSRKFYQEAFLLTPKNLDDWLSRRLQFYSGVSSGSKKDGVIFFDNGFIYNPKENTIRSNAGHIPRSLFIRAGNDFSETLYPNANIGFSALVIKEEEAYKCILLERELAGSIFSRLYFFNGAGLKHFSPFIDAEEGEDHIRVFNILW